MRRGLRPPRTPPANARSVPGNPGRSSMAGIRGCHGALGARSPWRSGFNLLVWGFPLAAMGVGFTVVALLLRRWTRRRRGRAAPPPVDAAMSERIRRELETER